MASKPALPNLNPLAAPVPDRAPVVPTTAREMLGTYYWFARSDRMWAKVMSSWHTLTEEQRWLALLLAAKRGD